MFYHCFVRHRTTMAVDNIALILKMLLNSQTQMLEVFSSGQCHPYILYGHLRLIKMQCRISKAFDICIRFIQMHIFISAKHANKVSVAIGDFHLAELTRAQI